MRTLLLLLCLATTASAQTPLFPNGTTASRAAPHWRIGLSGGFANGMETGTASLSVERTLRGPYSVGARAAGYSGSGFVDDGSSTEGGSLDVFGTAGTRDRVLDLRAGAGLGVAAVDYSDGGFFDCSIDEETGAVECPSSSGFYGVRPYLLGVVGGDLYLGAGIGVGAEVRAALMRGPANVSSAEIGLRVRLAR